MRLGATPEYISKVRYVGERGDEYGYNGEPVFCFVQKHLGTF